ncbi:MAG TPA: MBL fold metallo-hydrolase RNA specificity domain-containing protein [Methylibium sp.]
MQLRSASAHADAAEIIGWLRTAPQAPREVFVTHGEPEAADALRQRIARELGWPAYVPIYRDSVDLLTGQRPGSGVWQATQSLLPSGSRK